MRLDGKPSVGFVIFQLPDANALDVADRIHAKMDELSKSFPEGVIYEIQYDTTPYTRECIKEVFKSLRDAIILVAFVVLLFLQNWRSAIIPLIAVPVAIVGTFAVMAALGFSLNNLTLFGLVLAIGIVVDDAIVVVEAVEHHIENGMAPRDATIKAMSQVSGPVIAVGLVLSAVFVPCAFISGITGQFFRQFALTIAASTIISTFNSLTLSPALSAVLLRPREAGRSEVLPRLLYVAAGGWLAYQSLTPWLAAGIKDFSLSSAAIAGCLLWAAPGVACLRGGGHRLARGPPDRLPAGLALRTVQHRLCRDDAPLSAGGGNAAPPERTGAGGLRRAAVSDLLGLHPHPERVHPHAGHGLFAGERAIARRGLRRTGPASHRSRAIHLRAHARSEAHAFGRRPVVLAQRVRLDFRLDVRDPR